MTGAIILLIVIAIFGRAEGIMDAIDALENKPIKHAEGLFRRVVIGSIIVVVVYALVMPNTWQVMASACMVATGFFNPVFRYTLNTRRNLSWLYSSASNRYDRTFAWLASVIYPGRPPYTRWEMGSLLAYGVELSIAVGGLYLYDQHL